MSLTLISYWNDEDMDVFYTHHNKTNLFVKWYDHERVFHKL